MREPYLGVAVGKKGVGKSYTTDKMIHGYVVGNPQKGVKPRRALIMDVNDEYVGIKSLAVKDVVRFSMHRKIEARRIRPYRTDGQRMTLNEIADTLFFILENYRGGLLLIEDINKYVSDNLPNDLIGAICTNRHTDTDIIMHFQGIGRITPKIWQNLNWLRFHKNTESVDRHQKKFEDKYTMLKIVEIMVNHEYYDNRNERFYCYVDIDREKIVGNYNRESLDYAIEKYIKKNYRKVVAPIANELGMDGKKVYKNPTEAALKVKETLYSTYIDR